MSMTHSARSAQFPVSSFIDAGEFTPDPEGPELPPGIPFPDPIELPTLARPKWPPVHVCNLSLPQGCYQLNITSGPVLRAPRPGFGRSYNLGTLRVVHEDSQYAISGDTYRYSWLDILLGGGIPNFGPTTIPVYPRARYASYLKVTAVKLPRLSIGPCRIHMTVEEYNYTQPAAGAFDGTFPSSPSRVMDWYLTPITAPVGYTGAYFTGQIYIGGVLQSGLSVTLGWVRDSFRKATIEVHTMVGATAPTSVAAGGVTEYFDSIYKKAGWDLTVLTDPNPVAVPVTEPATIPTHAWSNSALHAVMTSLSDFSAVNLDVTWYTHVLVVQSQLGTGRGVMFDTINVPREGVASFSDDGYPTGDSPWFGAAANQMQRNVPRAFLRSCTHEITHGYNQIHQENEGGADNSIMTTTPSVANTIHAAAGIFPEDIILDFNEHVRHHLRHLPDPVIRPGGMTFTAGHNGIPIPSADEGDGDELVLHPSIALALKAQKKRVKIGEPLRIEWEMSNRGPASVKAPNFVGLEHEFADLTVIRPDGRVQDVAPFVIVCDAAQFVDLEAGEKRGAAHALFWSTQGFAFEIPGLHRVQLQVAWMSDGALVGATASIEVLVDYPVSERDNEVISLMMHPEVGKFIALGGHAYHLREAAARIRKVMKDHASHEAAKSLHGLFDEKRIPEVER